MNHKGSNIFILVVVVTGLSLSVPAPVAFAQANQGKEAGLPPLINVDEESVGYVRQGEVLAAGKDYAGAIEVLQGLLDRRKRCFVPTENPHLFVSLTAKANEVIGQLPPEGMKLYRRLYDPRAKRLLRTAAGQLDESALRNIIARYRHTSYGDDALNLLGAIMFDRGEFSQAAWCWRKTLSSFDSKDEPVLLAKIAVAYHYAGESARAAEMMKLLTKKHSQTRATIGGREQNVAAFAQRILAKPPPVAGPRRRQDWPCLAGAPDSLAVMGPCKPALSVRWTAPGGKFKDNPNIKAALSEIPRPHHRIVRLSSVSLREGRVVYTIPSTHRGKQGRQMDMPALIHPVVVGKTVLHRAAGGIVAHDLLTGEKLWETISFPLYRPVGAPRRYSHYGGQVEDRGQWTLTAGDGKVFAVGKFIPYSTLYYYLSRGRNLIQINDTSVLAAFSPAEKGRLLWQVGGGEGNTGLLRGGKFLTAPTYVAGRLYVMVVYRRAYHLVCLNAESGRLVWDTVVGQMPAPSWWYAHYQGYLRYQGSPPAVETGKVFVVTNAGVIAAFSADTGQSLWARQYDSSINRWHNKRATSHPFLPPNPIIVTKGRVICLPADCGQLLALRTDTGQLEWSADRRGQRNLTAVDRSRLLLSGKGLRIINAATGKNVWTGKKITGVHGRPAVTTDAILASGKGEIIRVSLKDFSVMRLPVKQPDAILGNLICVNGKLIAANAAGVSVYFPAVSTRSTQE